MTSMLVDSKIPGVEKPYQGDIEITLVISEIKVDFSSIIQDTALIRLVIEVSHWYIYKTSPCSRGAIVPA